MTLLEIEVLVMGYVIMSMTATTWTEPMEHTALDCPLEDFGFDSLEVIELIVTIEDGFTHADLGQLCDLSDFDVDGSTTPRQIAAEVYNRMGQTE